jgi:hypothetical protein
MLSDDRKTIILEWFLSINSEIASAFPQKIALLKIKRR